MTRRLALPKHRLQHWNREEVGNIFRRLKTTKAAITTLQEREDRKGELPQKDLNDLQCYYLPTTLCCGSRRLFRDRNLGSSRSGRGTEILLSFIRLLSLEGIGIKSLQSKIVGVSGWMIKGMFGVSLCLF